MGDRAGWGHPGRGSGRGDAASAALCPGRSAVGGPAPAGGGLEVHAWVVWQGAVLNDSPDVAQRYAVLDQLNEQIHLPHTN
ncbi:MAG: lasso peptide biosynthesis protein [Ardenticatenaceae bacterium]|nr:lasso peptide biosynthesis protein [Ardenticatenaceae bacterium]